MQKDEHLGNKIQSYTFTRLLGKGAFGAVYEAYNEKTRSSVACKIIPKAKLDQQPKLTELVQTEVAVLRQCRSENVIGFVESFRTNRNIYICMEFCNGGDLENYVRKKGGKLREDEAVEFLKQMLNGFRGLHEVDAMHRDFKSANVLLHNGVAKIADLGFAKILKDSVTHTILGTCLTMAPELLENKAYGFECDIWSLGVVYFEMLTGVYPFPGINDMEVLRKIKKGPPVFPTQVQISKNSIDFILKCLTVDPHKRINWKAIYQHPLLQHKFSMIHNLSLTNIHDSLDFYKKYLPKQNQPKPAEIPVVKDQAIKQQELKQIEKQMETLKIIEAHLQKYSKMYLEQRNSIMLILKHGVTPIYSLESLPISHHLYAFLMCKKAYIDMTTLQNALSNKTNLFNITDFWNEFRQSKEYTRVYEFVRSDNQLIYNYASTFMVDVETKNPMLKAELNLTNCTPKYVEIMREELRSYAFQLFDCRDKPNQNKAVIMRLITFLCDIANGIQISSEQYDAALEALDVKKMEQQFAAYQQSCFSKT